MSGVPARTPYPPGLTARFFDRYGPALVTCLAAVLIVAAVIGAAGGDPLALARLGTRYSQGDPNGTQGYDGQFVFYIARDLSPNSVTPYLDAPAYRYQRILLPLMARLLSAGSLAALPWSLAVLGIFSHVVGTWLVSELLAAWGVSRWYALVYGLWVGFLISIRLDLSEPLAYALVAGAFLANERKYHLLTWVLLSLALFAKEVTVLFLAAFLLEAVLQRRWRDAIVGSAVTLLPYAIFQTWLWAVFGQAGIGSGGAMATPFELIPFMGLLRIGASSLVYLAAMAVVFGPAVILPSIWGLWASIRKWMHGERNVIVLALLFNAAIIPFLPFSTFREPGGMIRFACGLVLAVLLFAACYRQRRVLNYSWFWIVLNVFLIKTDV